MPEITVGDWEETNLDEVASLTFDALQGSPFSSPERSLEDVEGWLNWNRARAHRGRGLGRRMLVYSLMNVARDYDTVTLAVDVDNTSAYDLYVDVGFDVVYRIITHAWKCG